MPTVKQIFAKKDFPSFITKHPIFKTVKTVKKIFPDIGLPNCEKNIKIDNSEQIRETAEDLIDTMTNYFYQRIPYSKQDRILLSNLERTIQNSILFKDGKVSLNLSKPITDKNNKIVFKQGEGVFKVYNKLQKEHEYSLPQLDTLDTFKRFSSA